MQPTTLTINWAALLQAILALIAAFTKETPLEPTRCPGLPTSTKAD